MAKTEKPKLRVWHIPQVPMKAFRVEVASAKEAKLLLKALADYDIFQFENKVKPDYCNAQGLETLEDIGNGAPEWVEWHDDNDRDIGELMQEER
jgi:hypothetical protein